MRILPCGILLLSLAALSACDEAEPLPPPPPAVLDETATGHFCMMDLAGHPGPKGQAFIAGKSDPLWFPSVRDLLTFRVLPGENEEILALYVSDTAASGDYEKIDPTRWVAAEAAFYVLDSTYPGGMGSSEAVPFARRVDAEAFAGQYGGRVLGLDEIGRDWIFGETG